MQTIVAEFSIPYLQFINEDASVTSDLPAFAKDHQRLREWYRLMVLTRTVDNKAISLQRTGKMGTYPTSFGQEAISVGVGAMMATNDILAPYYREIGAQLQRGVTIEEIFAYWGGDERGNHFANCADFSFCVPISSQCLHAVGAAFAFQYRNEPRVAVTFVGDGGTSKGDFYEAINLAGIWNLPVIFIINNNQWAISVPRAIQTATTTLAQKAIAAGIKGIQVDGNDIIAVAHATELALIQARTGKGPTLIEAVSYRLGDHTTADDARRYRSENELAEAKSKEPLLRFTKYLLSNNVLTDSSISQIQQDCSQAVESAVQNYINTPPQAPESMFTHMYAQWPKVLDYQRADLLENIGNG